jgi:hypothetical protein
MDCSQRMKFKFGWLQLITVAAMLVMAAGFIRTLHSLWKYTGWQPVATGVAVFAVGYILSGISFSKSKTDKEKDTESSPPEN